MEVSKWEEEEEAKYRADLADATPGDKFSVNMSGFADATVIVKITPGLLEQATDEDGKIDVDHLNELIQDIAHDRRPNICAQCGGWGNPDVSLGLGDDWDIHPGATRKTS